MALQRNKSGLSSRNHGRFEYDVFLSFRGEDTRNNFTGFFHYILKQEGINAFFDEEDLPKGERIEEILEAIRKSKILVPIFSQRYAESKWCLREVAKMVECVGSKQERLIIPIFFDVDPTDVRHQTGPFEAAFTKHHQEEKSDEVDGWRRALEYIGGISGYHLKDQFKGNQPQLVASIVDAIQKVLTTKRLLHEEEYLVGIDVRVKEIINRLDFKAKGARIIGIHGIGGIGKTTLAKAIYNGSRHLFQACCFIENVREVSRSSKGLVQLQQQLVQDISKGKHKKEIHNLSQGAKIIEDMVRGKSVLLVLDYVDDQKQLDALAGNISRFHSGSRVIVTTRQKKILEGLQDEAVYSVEELKEKEALQLFNHHAFGADGPQDEYINLIKEVVLISKRVPLALQVLGAHFKRARTPEQWKKWVKDLRRRQHWDIHEKLRICYDSLNDEEKQIFLDIACLLVGKNSEDAIYVWEDLKLLPDQALQSLQDRSLIKINKEKEFEMHDIIRDMGREVVLRESSRHPDNRSRWWDTGDIMEALSKSQGNEIQGILLNLHEGSESEMEFSTKAIGLMAQLRVLLTNVSISKEDCDFKHFPANLKWLEWKECPLGELPLESKFKGILVLNLSHSLISQLWKQTTKESSSMPMNEMFKSLKVLDLSCCERLIATANFAMAPNLEKLILDECSNLKEVDDSIAALKKLVFLSMKGCVSLEKLPSKIYELSSLKVFNLEGCSNLVAFPQFPSTISTNGLSNLQDLILRGCECLEFVPPLHKFRSLKRLHMDGCQSLDDKRDCLFEDDVAGREWDELGMSESRSWKEEFSFMLPCGSVNDPLLLKQLLCHSHDDPINNGTMILRVRYEDIANGDWVDTILEAYCDDSFGNDDIYCYTVQLPWDDKVSEASRRTSIQMKVRPASNHVLTKVDVKLQKRSKFSGENMKPFIILSGKSRNARPEFSIFINLRKEYKPDVIGYSRKLDDRIDKLRRLDVQVREQRPLFGWTIEELVILSLIFSDVKVSWHEKRPGTALPRQAREKVFDKMKVLNLSQCKFLVKTPDFARTPHLETLILNDCEGLEEIGESIRQLKKLARLSIVGCTKLRTLPYAILQLNSLLVLNLSKCYEFVNIVPEASFTDVSSNALRELILDDCIALRKLPKCFGRVKSLLRLSLRGCHSLKQLPDSIEGLVALEVIILDDCDLLKRLPDCVGQLRSLRRLYMRGCRSLKQLPDSVESLETLEKLMLDDCVSLARLPDSIGNLKRLTKMRATGCLSLESMPDLVKLTALEELNVGGCTNLISIPGLQNLRSLKVLNMNECWRLDIDSVYLQLEEAAFPHLKEFSISTRYDVGVDTMQIPVPPLYLESLTLCGRTGRADVLEIKVGEESVGYLKGPEVKFTDYAKINKRLRVLATATRDDACPRFRTLAICCPPGTHLLKGASIWFRHSLTSEPSKAEDCQCQQQYDDDFCWSTSREGCRSVKQLPDSVGCLETLEKLIADDCVSLERLPDYVGRLQSLRALYIRACRSVKQLPDSLRSLETLEKLILNSCVSLERLPDCVGRLQSLRLLYIRGCHSLTQLPDSVGSLETLEELKLDDCCHLATLPYSIGNLKRLTKLQATDCPLLKSMPDLQNLTALEELNVGGCFQLIRIPGLQNLRSLKVLNMNECWRLDIDSVCLQLEGAACPHLEAFSISKRCNNGINTIQIPFPPLHLEQVVLYFGVGWAGVLEIKVGEESVGYFEIEVGEEIEVDFEESEVTFREDDEINKRLRALATAMGDDASPRFRTLTICSPGTPMLGNAYIRFHKSLMSGPGP